MNEKIASAFKSEIHEKYAEEIRQGLPGWSGKPEELSKWDFMNEEAAPSDRTRLFLSTANVDTEKEIVEIQVNSLRELFRGDVNPGEFEDYPEEYLDFFASLEYKLIEWFRFNNTAPITDDTFIELYSALRRRPDGKSTGFLHDLVWQQLAFFLLTNRCSRGQYESCLQRLERGARKFHMNFHSHNYFDYLLNVHGAKLHFGMGK